VYFGSWDSCLYAIESSSQGLANSPWPKFHHDNFNTGRASGSGITEDRPSAPTEISLSASIKTGVILVSYTLPGDCVGTLRLYNALGRRVAQVPVVSTGETRFNEVLPVGAYFARLETQGGAVGAKVVLVR